MNPRNQKSLNLDQDSRRNHQVNKREISKIKNHVKPKLKLKLTETNNSKLKSKAIGRKIMMKYDLQPNITLELIQLFAGSKAFPSRI